MIENTSTHLEEAADAYWMARALQLAAKGLYTTGTNPRVGCVLVKNQQQIGVGWHERAGEPHAEIMALRDAAQSGEGTQGATAYVTLEPCAHYGKTPPCADALVAAGVTRVVAAMEDPNPLVAGQGLARLQHAGIAVTVPLMAAAAEALNVGFVQRMKHGVPWVRLKLAGSLDGRSALANGQSQWITGAEARADGHRFRARAQAIVTGVGTVLADDPQLTVRGVSLPLGQRDQQPVGFTPPLRVVVDTHLRTPDMAKIVGAGCLIVTTCEDVSKIQALQRAGAEVVVLPAAAGQVNLPVLLRDLAKRGVNEVHVEAGPRLSGSFMTAGCVNEILAYLAPCLLGSDARGWCDHLNVTRLDQKIEFKFSEVRMVGADLRIIARPCA